MKRCLRILGEEGVDILEYRTDDFTFMALILTTLSSFISKKSFDTLFHLYETNYACLSSIIIIYVLHHIYHIFSSFLTTPS